MKGKIHGDFSPCCGICENMNCGLAERTAKRALATAKEHGWRVTRAHGLVCPQCAKNL